MERLNVLLEEKLELLEQLRDLIDEADAGCESWLRIDGGSSMINVTGVGEVISTGCDAAVADPKALDCGRDFSAWLGVVPSQHYTGDKVQLGAITKRGSS